MIPHIHNENKMRDIKFRAFNTKTNQMLDYDDLVLNGCYIAPTGKGLIAVRDENERKDHLLLMQFTGKYCHNNRELYEGDILFYEEAEEDGDTRYYLVIVWIPEWCMFASLDRDESKAYVEVGVDAIDETMFWTFSIEHSEEYHYAGNIYETPKLLEV